MLRHLRIVVVLFTLVSISAWQAKDKPGEISDIQEKKKIIFSYPVVYCEYFMFQDSTGNYLIQEYHKLGKDSIVLFHSMELISRFAVYNGYKTDNKYTEYRNGKLYLEDSLSSDMGGYYYGFSYYYSSGYYKRHWYKSIWEKIYWPDGRLKTLMHNGRQYRDSFFQSWFENGLTKQVKTKSFQLDYYAQGNARKAQYFNRHGSDSFVQEWYPSGIVSSIKNNGIQCLYYENGILKQINNINSHRTSAFSPEGILQELSMDTLVNGNSVRCIKTYSQKGILQSMKYYLRGDIQPCHIWIEYNTEGRLVKTIQKSTLKKQSNPTAPLEFVEGPVEDNRIFTQVDQRPYFIGGSDAFYKYLDEHFSDLDKKIMKKLDGCYEITFKVEKDHNVIFIGLKGYEAGLIKEKVRKVVEGMKWGPAKINGKAYTVELMLSFEVVED